MATELATAPRTLPWDSIRHDFAEGIKFQDAIEQVGLNYEVEFRGVSIEGVGPAEHHRATVRTDTNAVLGIVGGRYQIVQNRDAFSFMQEIVDSGELQTIGAGWWKNGARPWMQARLPKDIVVGGTDVLIPFIFIATSHDGSTPVTTSLSAIRVICQNTYAANLHSPRRFQIRHLASIDGRITEARRVLGLSFSYFDEYAEAMNRLSEVKMVDEQFKDVVNALFPLPALRLGKTDDDADSARSTVAAKRAQLLGIYLNSPTVPRGTQYGALQAVTEWYDHYKNGQRNKGTRVAVERKSEDILMGDGVLWKDKAMALIAAKGR